MRSDLRSTTGAGVRAFDYHAPSTLDAAVALLAAGDARCLAGGTDLVAQLREGRRTVARVVDLKQIDALRQVVRHPDGGWTIGAAVTIGALARHPVFGVEHKGILDAARLIGSLQIQNRASLGGNICNAAPSADGVPLLICWQATAEIVGPAGRRIVPVADLLAGPGRTTLASDEVLATLRLPPRPQRAAARYLRFTPRREMDIAVAGVGAVLSLDGDGRIADARLTLASVAPIPLRATAAEALLRGQSPTLDCFAAAADAAAAVAAPISDMRGSADYRRHLVAVLTRRALAACADELGAGRQ